VVSVFSDRTRSDDSPLSGETMYNFLDRVAGPVWDRIRQLIDDWVNGYSPDDQAEMVARLRNSRDTAFTAAYWELLLYHGLKALGFKVTCHPVVSGDYKTSGLPRGRRRVLVLSGSEDSRRR